MSQPPNQVTQPEPSEQTPSFDAIFSTRNPKDAVAGLSSGLKSIGKGLFGGVASLVALPIQGAREEGAVGFAKGLGLGLVSAVGLTVLGAGTGIIQVGRGIINTPFALQAKSDEKVWDQEKRVWYYYNLSEEAEQELKKPLAHAPSATIKDTKLYDILGIDPSATPAEVKKAYRVKAIRLHPDKNPNNPNASSNFQQLGEAYQVISNPALRASYDLHGLDAVDSDKLMDSSQLYQVIFGSERFEDLVGELQLMGLQGAMKPNSSTEAAFEGLMDAEAKLKTKQKRREVQCAVNLVRMLNDYLQDQSENHVAFKVSIEGQAKELTETAFGGTLIAVVGYVYEEQAESFLGFKKSVPAGLGLTNIAQSAHVFANQYRLLSSAVKTLQVARKEELRARKEELRTKTDANAEKHSSEPDPATVDTLLEALWNYTVMDVESTLRTVCTKVFKDSNVPFETRVQRAEGVLLIGQIFIKFGKSSTDGLSEVLAKFH